MRRLLLLALLAAISLFIWRQQLQPVSSGARRPLEAIPASARAAADVDLVLPAVPAGLEHVRPADAVTVISYWAPWIRGSRDHARGLDSLRHDPEFGSLHASLVCFDPMPSVTRYVARHRIQLSVLLDSERRLTKRLPCPRIPFTYVIDRSGRIAVAQSGTVDWWAPQSKAVLRNLLAEPREHPIRAQGAGRT